MTEREFHGVMVEARPGESAESILRRFRKRVSAERVISDFREHLRFRSERAKRLAKRRNIELRRRRMRGGQRGDYE